MSELKVLLCVVLLGASARAEKLGPDDVVKQTIEHNPTLRAAMSDVEQSVQSLRAEATRYRPTLLLDATGTTSAAPNLNSLSGTTRTTSQSIVVGADLQQTFSFGLALDLRVESRNTASQGPAFSGTSDTISLGPGYGVSARLLASQPLLRGFGDVVGQAQLRALQLSRTGQERLRDATASQALSTTLQAYWELWYAQRAVSIEEQARALAKQQRDEAQHRVTAGSLADADVLTYETRLAELDQSVLAAQINAQQQAITLERAVGAPVTGIGTDAPPTITAVTEQDVLQSALEASYVVTQQRVAVEVAQNAARTAAEATRPRLDAQAWVQTQGLGNQALAPAFEQLGTFQNVSANVGLVFELPLSMERHDAQSQAAAVAVRAAQARLDAAAEQVRADTHSELATLAQATQSLALAQRTVELAAKTVEAQHKRLENGTAISVEVQAAEDSLRRAQLSVERARINATKAEVRLANLTGRLLPKWSQAQ